MDYRYIEYRFNELIKNKNLQISIDIVREMLDVFQEKKKEGSVIDSFGFDEEYIICNLLVKCYTWNIDSSSLVKKIIQCVNHNKFEMFSHELFKVNQFEIWKFLYPERATKENHFMQYILYHSNKSQLILYKRRLISLLFEYVNFTSSDHTNQYKWDLFILLLRYGVDFLFEDMNYVGRIVFVPEILEKFFPRERNRSYMSSNENQLYLSYLLRADPYFRNHVLHEIRILAAGTNTVMESNLSYLVSELSFPLELKNICRFEIRKHLWKRWCLPEGIQSLPLPVALKDYLDLLIL